MLWCKFKYDGPSEKAPGFHRYVCQRRSCYLVAHSPYPIENNVGICQGFPDDSEIGEWLEYFKRSFELGEAEAICWYIRWRVDGSDLSELPPPLNKVLQQTIEPPAPDFGPGSELERIFHDAGASPDQCGGVCAQWRDQMNRWGVSCREHRQQIITHIQNTMFKTWVLDQIKIGWSIKNEPWFKYSDPVGCIVDEAIRRAEANQSQQSSQPETQEGSGP
jgi:hypothetical protein